MKDVMVSIRMPPSLVEELQALAEEEHYLDLSELIRGIARKRWLHHSNPELAQIKELTESIEIELTKATAQKIQKEVSQELQKIRDSLKKGGGLQ